MNVILRDITRRMLDQPQAPVESESFISWLRAEGYADYVIDCRIRRLLFVLPSFHPALPRRHRATLILLPCLAANAARLLGSPTSRARAGFTRATYAPTAADNRAADTLAGSHPAI